MYHTNRIAMGSLSKTTALLLTIIVAMSCLTALMVKPASAQTIPKPSVPAFTLRYIDNSYDVPPVYGIDQYTGKNITITAGYRAQNSSVEITIENQPFTPYYESNAHYIVLFYNVSYKGHFANDWQYYSYDPTTRYFIKQSDNTTTIIPFTKLPEEGQLDFCIQALIGYYTETGHPFMDVYLYDFTGQTSDWSSTQTVTIPASSISPTPNPTVSPTPTQTATTAPSVPELSWLAIVPLLLSVFAVALVLRHRKTPNYQAKF